VAALQASAAQAGQTQVEPDTGQTPDEEPVRKAPAPTAVAEAVTEREQGLFGRRLSFEVGTTYSHFDNARLNLSGFLALDAIFLGEISIDSITSDVITLDASLRYGITDRLQVDVAVPYLQRFSNFRSGGAGADAGGLTEVDISRHGLGDISAGASYRLFRETLRRPDVVLSSRVKFPTGDHPFGVELVEVPGSEGNLSVPRELSTGSGVYGASIGVSLLKTLDPLVVFGSLSYFNNFEEEFDDLDEAAGDQPGKVKIGDSLQFGAGVAFALNERSSLSLSFSQRLVEHTKIQREGAPSWSSIVGSQANVGVVNFGGTFALTRRFTIITGVGWGVTDDSPDMLLSFRLPFRF
jgi:hypothetical protein